MTYITPVATARTSIVVVNSRFIATAGCVQSVAEARSFLALVRAEMPDASHHVYAFRIGYGNSVIEGMSDDGEPSGTAGPPVLSVLRGTEIGDIIIVVTRFFGGTKLGTGGLVRAYSEAARQVLSMLRTEEKIEKQTIGLECSYSLYEPIKRLITKHQGVIDDETFTAAVTMVAVFPKSSIPRFQEDLQELSAGRVSPVIMDDP
ncbi:MAG: YigZ family protein [Anaerolineae bacterium]|nr:YigZ family protein [Anaerolineae bacterium]